jgi:hypothetical protein
MRRAGLAVEQRRGRPPWKLGTRLPSQDLGFGRFLKLDVRETGIRAKLLAGPQQPTRERNLGLAERIKGMAASRVG